MTSSPTPRVSVIIPTHGRPDFLRDAIASVIDQSYIDWEAIVVENGCEPQASVVIDQFQDSRLLYTYIEQANRALARNRGVDLSKGEYLAFLDDDDLFLRNKLIDQVTFLDSNQEIGMVVGGTILVDDNGNLLDEWKPWNNNSFFELERCLREGCLFQLGSMLLRRECFCRIGGFRTDLPLSHDIDLFLRLLVDGCIMSSQPTFVSIYRIHSRSTHKDIVLRAECRRRMIEGVLSNSKCPLNVMESKDVILYSVSLYSCAQCYVGNEAAAARAYLEAARSFGLGAGREMEGDLVEAIISVLGRFEFSDPYCQALAADRACAEALQLTRPLRAQILGEAAKLSFYRGFQLGRYGQVLRSLPRALSGDPRMLRERGTWSIMVRSALRHLREAVRDARRIDPVERT